MHFRQFYVFKLPFEEPGLIIQQALQERFGAKYVHLSQPTLSRHMNHGGTARIVVDVDSPLGSELQSIETLSHIFEVDLGIRLTTCITVWQSSHKSRKIEKKEKSEESENIEKPEESEKIEKTEENEILEKIEKSEMPEKSSTLNEPLAVSVCESLSIDISLPERIRSLNGIYLISQGPTCGNVVPVLMTSVMVHLNNPSCENEFSKTKLKKLRKCKELAKFKFKHCNLAKFTQ